MFTLKKYIIFIYKNPIKIKIILRPPITSPYLHYCIVDFDAARRTRQANLTDPRAPKRLLPLQVLPRAVRGTELKKRVELSFKKVLATLKCPQPIPS